MAAHIEQWYTACPHLQAAEHPTEYGRIALRYILAAEVDLFGLFSDLELEAVHHACRFAVVAPEMSPIAVETITQLQLRIWRILECRKAEAQAQPAEPAQAQPEPKHDIPGGRLVPTHPKPQTQPPAPALAVPEWRF